MKSIFPFPISLVSAIMIAYIADIHHHILSTTTSTSFLVVSAAKSNKEIICEGNYTYSYDDPSVNFLPPASAKCNTIDGSLWLYHCDESKNCNFPKVLTVIKKITGILGFHGVKAAPTNSIISEVGSLVIASSPMTSIKPLSKLTKVNNIDIVDTSLKSLEGLGNIAELQGLRVVKVPLQSLSSLKLKSANDVIIYDIPELTSLKGFENLEAVGSMFALWNTGVKNLEGLKNLQSNQANIYLFENKKLQSLDGLNSLKKVDTLTVFNNPELKSVQIPSLEKVNIFQAYESPELESIGFVGNEINQILLGNLQKLTRIDGFKSLTSVQDIFFSNLTALESVDGLSNVEAINNIFIAQLDSLKSLNGLSKVKSAAQIILSFAPRLQDVNLTSLANASDIILGYLDSLENVRGFSNVLTINGTFSVSTIPKIRNFDGLNKLKSLKSYAIIADKMPFLESIQIGDGGNLGRPYVQIVAHQATKLKWKPTEAFLKKVCPKNTKISWNGCPQRGTVRFNGQSNPFSNLHLETPQEVAESIINSIPRPN